MLYRIDGIRLALDEDVGQLKHVAADVLGINEDDIASWRIVRRSVDARRNRPPVAVYLVDVETSAPVHMPTT
ncbi:MAG: hypothetical protein PHN75_20195, partial [Syntrophales bacterium]|nr:hypothetical protein [Syntrophales bacterium]